MKVVECAGCGVRVVLKANGDCPSCGVSNAGASSFPAPAPTSSPQPAEVVNPYQSATTAGPQREPAPQDGKKAKQPFSYQAARFSFYAPIVHVLLTYAVGFSLRDQPQLVIAMLAVGAIGAVLIPAGLVLGIVGLVGGVMRYRLATIIYALLGLIFNTGFIALVAITMFLAAALVVR